MDMEAYYLDDGVRFTMSLSKDETSILITMSKVGVIELDVIIPIDELRLAIRKLTAK